MGYKCNLGRLSPNTPNDGDGHTKCILNLQLQISHSVRSKSSLKTIWRLSYTSISIFGASIQSNLGILDPNTQTHGQGYTRKVIHSLHIQILHHVWSYSSVKVIWGFSDQGFIQAILKSGRQHKNLNLLIEFSNSIFKKLCFKAYWRWTYIQNKRAY